MRTLVPFLFYQLPEAFLLILAALVLLGLKVRPDRLLLAGLTVGVLGALSRIYLFRTGFHTPVILCALTVTMVIAFKISIRTALTGCFLSFFLLIMGESLLVAPVLSLVKIPFQDALSHPWLHIAFGWLSDGFLVLAILICLLSRGALIRAPEA